MAVQKSKKSKAKTRSKRSGKFLSFLSPILDMFGNLSLSHRGYVNDNGELIHNGKVVGVIKGKKKKK